MLDIQCWMAQYQAAILHTFGSRVLFIGLQGSYGRGEAFEGSDIDAVLILNTVSPADLRQYREVTAALPHHTLLCGFVSGRTELSNWCRADLFQFYYDTTAWYGTLETILPIPKPADAHAAVLAGACSLYHTCSHNYLHARDPAVLAALFKSASFVLRAKHFCETGVYCKYSTDLSVHLTGSDAELFRHTEACRRTELCLAEFDAASAQLLMWSSGLIHAYGCTPVC